MYASNDGDVPGICATDGADASIQPPCGDEEAGTPPEHSNVDVATQPPCSDDDDDAAI